VPGRGPGFWLLRRNRVQTCGDVADLRNDVGIVVVSFHLTHKEAANLRLKVPEIAARRCTACRKPAFGDDRRVLHQDVNCCGESSAQPLQSVVDVLARYTENPA
jgi:hypothetical protein